MNNNMDNNETTTTTIPQQTRINNNQECNHHHQMYHICPEPANWKYFLTALVGILAVFFGLIPRSTYCDVSVMKYICFRHLINVGVFSVLFITVILLCKMLLGKNFNMDFKLWYIVIVILFSVSLALNFLVNKYKEDANELIL